MAVVQLGGHPVTFRKRRDRRLGSREPIDDIARVLSGYHAALGARVFDHRDPRAAGVGVDDPGRQPAVRPGHPCQRWPTCSPCAGVGRASTGRTVAWVGDFNNVARSLSLGVAALRACASASPAPRGYGPTEADIDRMVAAGLDGPPVVTDRPAEAVRGRRRRAHRRVGLDGPGGGGRRPPPRLRGLPGRRPR